ncbi:hypothetical protein AQUCO_02800196v1 [Aquilegia coerulea]|uniref:F-box domain-containing protein n=1 Tax=Aquilegia coerulea TaxID=218851 RepID=A0A2G5D4C7_AQUCA|nr:hypothetical protein AQUCO_02800196v1 [Aquilegia coerulea]
MSSMISNISEDVLMEILCKLPVKFIIQCKCVCKPWRTLVTTTRFVKFHLSQANKKSPNLLLASSFHKNFYSLDCETCDECVRLNLDMPPLNRISIVGSCNGLVCLSDDKSYVLLWNPSTREHVIVHYDHLGSSDYRGDRINNNERSTAVMGFGYDSFTEDYKLVKIEYFYDVYGFGTMTEFDRCEVRVSTLGTNSWRLIDDTPSPPCYIGNLFRVAHVNGVLYWVGLRGIGIELSKSIISFDLRTEKFGEVSWPEFEDHSYRDLGLGVLRGSLCVFSYHLEHVDIWVKMDYGLEESWSWTRQFFIARSTKYLEPLVLLKNGEILLQMGYRSLLVYNPRNETVTVPNVRGIPDRFRTSTYVESLTSVASLMGMAGNCVVATISKGEKNEVAGNI